MNILRSAGVFLLCAGVTVVVLGGLIAVIQPPSNSGIIAHESGQAAYITGECCTVNATDSMTAEEIEDLLDWCAEQMRNDRASRGLEDR